MSLIKCPECSKEVSDQAQVCPNCGFDIVLYIKNTNNKEKKAKRIKELIKTISSPEKPKMPEPLNNKKHIVIEIIASILLTFSIWCFFFSRSIFEANFMLILLGIMTFLASCLIFVYSFEKRDDIKSKMKYYDIQLKRYLEEYKSYTENPRKYKIEKAKQIYEIEERKQNLQKKLSSKQQINNQSNIPKCPTCQSTKIRKISTTTKVANTAMFGVAGTKRHKTFHCNNCGYEW